MVLVNAMILFILQLKCNCLQFIPAQEFYFINTADQERRKVCLSSESVQEPQISKTEEGS
jgi:hypothetical protein